MLLIIAIVIAALWFFGLLAHVGGGLINLLLVVALIAFIVHIVTGRRATNV